MKRKKEYVSPESSIERVITTHLVCETLSGGGQGGPGIAEAKEREEEEEEFIEFQNAMDREKKGSLW